MTARPLSRKIELETGSFAALRRIDVLRLRRNLGHQRAIAIGLAYVEDCLQAGAVVVMDGDGEDDPADVPRLLERLDEEGNGKIVFAERARRSESLVFRIFYALFKLLHLFLTGKGVRVGNFSAIPRRRLSSLVVVAEIWNHYAAAVFRSRQPYCMIPTYRSRRLCGSSSMNFVSLVTHGLSAISVYSDVVGVRLLVMSIILAFLTLAGMVGAVLVRLATNLAIPGWASYTVGILLVLFVQAIMAAFVFSFVILGSRHGTTFLPRRDYSFFIGSIWTLHGSRAIRGAVADSGITERGRPLQEVVPCHLSTWERSSISSPPPSIGKRMCGVRCVRIWAGTCWRSERAMAARRACSAAAGTSAGFASSPTRRWPTG